MNTAHNAWCWTSKHGLTFGVAALLLSGCTSTGTTPPGAVLDAIQIEMGAAVQPTAKAESQTKAVDLALLPDMPSGSVKPAEARFDLVVQNAPASQVFMGIVTGTPFSMLVSPEVSGTLTLTLKNVTVKEALDTIQELYGFEYRLEGDRIFIQPTVVQSRVFQINYLSSRRQGNSDLQVSSSANSSAQSTIAPQTASAQPTTTARGTESSRVSTSSDTDYWGDLRTALCAVLGIEDAAATANSKSCKDKDGRSLIISPMSGVLIVRAYPKELRNVANYLRATQQVVERQVMIEAKIVDVTLSSGFQSGVNWAAFDKNGGHRWSNNANTGNFNVPGGLPGTSAASATTNAAGPATPATASNTLTGDFGVLNALGGLLPVSSAMGLAFQTGSFAALISYLETQGSVAVLSSPRIATLNNQKALLKVGDDEIYAYDFSPGTQSVTAGVASTPPVPKLKSYFSGISLDVTPQIDEDGNIILHVHPSVSTVTERVRSFGESTSGALTVPLASVTINETDSVVRVQNGNIVAIGGLMRQRQINAGAQVPGVGDIPAVGNLFGQKNNSMVKSEMVILLKPTVIKDENDWKDGLKDVQKRLKEYAPSAPVRIIRP